MKVHKTKPEPKQDYSPQALTDLAIKNFKPKIKDGNPIRTEVRDTGTDCAMYLLIQPGGHKSFAFRYERGGKSQKFTLGPWREDKKGDHLSLARARVMAEEVKEKIARGIDPAGEKREAKRERQAAEENTLQAVCENFLRLRAGMSTDPAGNVVFKTGKASMRSGPLWHQTLERLVFPTLGKLPLQDIKRKHITALLDKVESKNGPSMATNVLAILRAILNWAATRDDDYVSPIVRGMARIRTKERARTRVLADDEIRDVWAALDTANVPSCYPSFVRMLFYTAVRRVEASGMREAEVRTEIDRGDLWIIPASRYKSKHDHIVPLSPQAKALIDGRTEPFVFSTTGGLKAFVGFSAAKRALDAEIAKIRKRDGRPPMERWTHHDARRTAATLMNSIGVPSDHVEQVLGHALDGIKGTYNHYQYFNEKRDALTKLAAKLELILNPTTPANVLPFPQAAGGKDARPE